MFTFWQFLPFPHVAHLPSLLEDPKELSGYILCILNLSDDKK